MGRMHEITWESTTSSVTWLVGDGLVQLPADAALALGARGLLVAGRWAALVGTALEPLAADEPLARGDGQLRWRPQRPRPLRLDEDDTTTGDPHHRRSTALHLVGPDGRRAELDGRPILIGRSQVCHWSIDHPSVSGLHCSLHRHGHGVRVVDLGSTNGTWVDGSRVHAAYVSRRARVRLGPVTFELLPPEPGGPIALSSPQAVRLAELVDRVATSRAPVLIHGESGVGKEGIARRLHRSSGRPGAFVALNAAVLTPNLASSQLFGHAAGAFTGAEHQREGAFMAADRGTLFLDEIAELPPETQAELLRVLEDGRVRRLGEVEAHPVDVRLVGASHQDLAEQVRHGRFREDLFHRICVVPLWVPPLRERLEDLRTLAEGFVALQEPPRRLTERALARLERHPFPGNIRELKNILHRAAVFHDVEILDEPHLDLPEPPSSAEPDFDALIHDAVLQAYEKHGRNVAATARALGLHRAVIYRLLKGAG